MTPTLLEELKRLLNQPFLTANLDAASILAFESSWNTNHPLGLFVLERVLHILSDHWDVDYWRGQAWMTDEAFKDMEARLRPPLLAYLDAAESGSLTPTEELTLLNAIVSALFRWTAERPNPRPKRGM